MNVVIKNQNKLERLCPCIGKPKEMATKIPQPGTSQQNGNISYQQKVTKTSMNNSQITKNMKCAFNAKYGVGTTINYTQYLAYKAGKLRLT